MSKDQAPRQNRDGHPCPDWCATDHRIPVCSLSHWSANARIEEPGNPSAWVSVRAAHLGSASDRPAICVSASRPGTDLRLAPDDAAKLAGILDVITDWSQVIALAAAIRRAAVQITEA